MGFNLCAGVLCYGFLRCVLPWAGSVGVQAAGAGAVGCTMGVTMGVLGAGNTHGCFGGQYRCCGCYYGFNICAAVCCCGCLGGPVPVLSALKCKDLRGRA